GTSLFAATGNTEGASTWAGGESVFRFSAGPVWSGNDPDRFTPTDWPTLDNTDEDIGSSNPLLVDLPGQPLVVQMGKNGVVYLLDRNNLGGLSGGLFNRKIVSGAPLTNGPATLSDSAGVGVFLHTYVSSTGCTKPSAGFTALRVLPGPPPVFTFAWCGAPGGV